MVFQDMSWKDLQVFFKTKEKAENMVKRVKWADKLEEIRYFIKEKDLNSDSDVNEKQEDEIEARNNKNKACNSMKTDSNIEVINEQQQQQESQGNKPAYRFTKEMVRLALYRNGGSNAQKNWKKLFRLVSSAVLDDRINEIMESEWV